MSRIGKKPIAIPKGVLIDISRDHVVQVKGPKGTLQQPINPDITVQIEGEVLSVTRPTEQKRHRALHGLYRALIQNMVTGVTEGYKKSLELIGVGYKVSVEKNYLKLDVGYAHQIWMLLPTEIQATTEQQKGKAPVIHLESHDKQLLGQICAKIRSCRKPEPYKGKGIRFVGEEIRRKAGKTVSK